MLTWGSVCKQGCCICFISPVLKWRDDKTDMPWLYLWQCFDMFSTLCASSSLFWCVAQVMFRTQIVLQSNFMTHHRMDVSRTVCVGRAWYFSRLLDYTHASKMSSVQIFLIVVTQTWREGESDIAVDHLHFALSHRVKSSLTRSNPAFFLDHRNCNLNYSEDTTRIRGLRFKPGGR